MVARLSGEKRLGITNRNAEIRTAEALHHGVGHPDDFAMMVEQRPARTARSGLGVVDELVGEDFSEVALRGDRADEIASRQFGHDLPGTAVSGSDDCLNRLFAGAREDASEA